MRSLVLAPTLLFGLLVLAGCQGNEFASGAAAGGAQGAGGSGGGGGGGSGGEAGGATTGPRFVFVSSVPHDGAFGGINTGLTGADDWCLGLANASLLDGVALQNRTWRAWLSTPETDAKDRLGATEGRLPEYTLVDGTTVFADGFVFGDQAGENTPSLPQNAINVDENGDPHPSDIVWTGTLLQGVYWGAGGGDCTGWSNGEDGASLVGSTVSADQWSHSNTGSCPTPAHLYCFEVAPP